MTGIQDALAQKHGDEIERLPCYQCGEATKRKDMRGHVGQHILRALVGQAEPVLLEPVRRTLCLYFSLAVPLNI